jgi:hypothetical protein
MNNRPSPVAQVRVIATEQHARAILACAAYHARDVLGPGHIFRTATRPARRAGHVRAYLTVTRKEEPGDTPHDSD